MSINCKQLVSVAEFLRGKPNPVQDNSNSINEALTVADCCRRQERFDLADEILSLLNVLPNTTLISHAQQIDRQKRLIASRSTKETDISANASHLPSLIVRTVNFADAMARWTAVGFPMRTQEEIDQRLAICEACPEFVDKVCRKCGCPCKGDKDMISKLSIATEHCPLGKWS